MEIIKTNKSTVTEPVKRNDALSFDEVFPDKKLDRHHIRDRDWAIFELIRTEVKETTIIQSSVIANRVSTPKVLVFHCLIQMWQAGVIRRFLKHRYGISKGQPSKSQIWYIINRPEDFILPKTEKPPSRRGKHLKGSIPDEIVAQIRRYGPEISTEAIAAKYGISISWTEAIRNYETRKEILP